MKPSKESVDYIYPSYGVVHVTRQSGNKENLFGTMSPGYNTVCLRISTAMVTHNPEQSTLLISPDKRLVEVNLSALQWAQMTSGVEETPCTITWFDGEFIEENPDPITKLKLIHEEFRLAMVELGKMADEIHVTAKELEAKPTVTKADRKQYRDLAGRIAANVVSIQPHLMHKIALVTEQMIAEAKADKAAPPGS